MTTYASTRITRRNSSLYSSRANSSADNDCAGFSERIIRWTLLAQDGCHAQTTWKWPMCNLGNAANLPGSGKRRLHATILSQPDRLRSRLRIAREGYLPVLEDREHARL